MKFDLSNEGIKSRSAVQQCARLELELGSQCDALAKNVADLTTQLRDAAASRDEFVILTSALQTE